LQCGRTAEFELPPPSLSYTKAIFVLGVRKSGSTLLNSLTHAMAQHFGMPYINVAGGMFQQDLKAAQWMDDPVVLQLFRPGYMHAGFRTAHRHFMESPVYRAGRKILLVRDPRDALVSQYFSVLSTHALPAVNHGTGGATEQLLVQRAKAARQNIDDYVLQNARALHLTMQQYVSLLQDERLTLFRYEEVILDKEPWLRRMLAIAELPAERAFIDSVMQRFDIRPASEDPSRFVRKVVPGDHLVKLRRATIESLNLVFENVAPFFGYRLQ
jgi:hypothetical protein